MKSHLAVLNDLAEKEQYENMKDYLAELGNTGTSDRVRDSYWQ